MTTGVTKATVRVIDGLGSIVWEGGTAEGTPEIVLDMRAWSAGAYIVTVTVGETVGFLSIRKH